MRRARRGARKQQRPLPENAGTGFPAAALSPPGTSVSACRETAHFLLSHRPRQPHGWLRIARCPGAAAQRTRHPHGGRGAPGGEALPPGQPGRTGWASLWRLSGEAAKTTFPRGNVPRSVHSRAFPGFQSTKGTQQEHQSSSLWIMMLSFSSWSDFNTFHVEN